MLSTIDADLPIDGVHCSKRIRCGAWCPRAGPAVTHQACPMQKRPPAVGPECLAVGIVTVSIKECVRPSGRSDESTQMVANVAEGVLYRIWIVSVKSTAPYLA